MSTLYPATCLVLDTVAAVAVGIALLAFRDGHHYIRHPQDLHLLASPVMRHHRAWDPRVSGGI